MNTTLQHGDPIADGKYIIDQELGEGGLAVVYKVRHATLDTPFAVKITESKKTEDNNPALGFDFMSSNIFSKKVWVSWGKILSMKLKRIASKFSILKNFGMKGIRFKTKRMNGKSAMKKLKEIDPALDVSVPLVKPRKYNSKRSKNENPFNPGIFI